MSEYPLHDKLSMLRREVELIGEFIDWLDDQEIDPIPSSDVGRSRLIGSFFGVDHNELQAEKDRMLEAIRGAQP